MRMMFPVKSTLIDVTNLSIRKKERESQLAFGRFYRIDEIIGSLSDLFFILKKGSSHRVSHTYVIIIFVTTRRSVTLMSYWCPTITSDSEVNGHHHLETSAAR